MQSGVEVLVHPRWGKQRSLEMMGLNERAWFNGAFTAGGDMDSMVVENESKCGILRPFCGMNSLQTGDRQGRGFTGGKEERLWGRRNSFLFLCLLTGVLFTTACVPEVLKQTVPVSTNPMGARVYVNGKPAGETPTSVELERTQSHVLTLVKENYRQADVVIQQRKKTDEQLFKAINAGVTTGMMFKDPTLGMMRVADAYSTQEKTGEAYELLPSAVIVDLEPLDSAGTVVRKDGQSVEGGTAQMGESQSGDTQSNGSALIRGALLGGAAAGAVALSTQEKKWETSSSTKTTVSPDGTVATKSSSSSVGVSVNPLGVINLIDTLYK